MTRRGRTNHHPKGHHLEGTSQAALTILRFVRLGLPSPPTEPSRWIYRPDHWTGHNIDRGCGARSTENKTSTQNIKINFEGRHTSVPYLDLLFLCMVVNFLVLVTDSIVSHL